MAGVMADNALSVRVQKTALEQRSTGFRILLDAPDAIYHPGDVVKGRRYCILNKRSWFYY
ncbi:hypothetical protein BDF19DRAFT_444673 [Syncephalis fuscata]|nr:hypothetical protein BDF19DRAFT_444673 [Syncephalis fuscata]